MEITDLAGVAKPLEKLVETVSQGLGVLYEPHQIRRRAQAEAHAELIKMDAELQKIELVQRAAQRISFKELRAQINIDNIVAEASKYLPDEVDDQPVNPDWLSRFFDDCQSVSDEDLQVIWGKILAGEVSKPGKYSRITLSILKNISKEDAFLFEKIASLAWNITGRTNQNGSSVFIPIDASSKKDKVKNSGVMNERFIHLADIGIINFRMNFSITVTHKCNVSYFDNIYSVNLLKAPSRESRISAVRFTRSGLELLPLLNVEYDFDWEKNSIAMMSQLLGAEFSLQNDHWSWENEEDLADIESVKEEILREGTIPWEEVKSSLRL